MEECKSLWDRLPQHVKDEINGIIDMKPKESKVHYIDADLISRQDAINELEKLAFEMKQWTELFQIQAKGVLTARNIIEDLPSAQQWIPCSERLPEDGMRIIVQCGDGGLGVIERVRLKIWNLINSPYAKVVAWMPAPEPWEGEK